MKRRFIPSIDVEKKSKWRKVANFWGIFRKNHKMELDGTHICAILYTGRSGRRDPIKRVWISFCTAISLANEFERPWAVAFLLIIYAINNPNEVGKVRNRAFLTSFFFALIVINNHICFAALVLIGSQGILGVQLKKNHKENSLVRVSKEERE